ncbi:hypothetical protein [Natrinema salsiterrestre]|uniref:Uncharacterized protein n=1 Tax=Natrinema salsiterrestre TaxID=2950540 RepID=A0A9Q4PZC4_9EURY|nr:hypothetical protein [Natrinema salsiterrestre]MDF9744630.1 hypothetical protein [Natrinema salsiterrestre]
MISRSALAAVCLGIVIVVSLPAGAYATLSSSGPASPTSLAQDDPYRYQCLNTAPAENVSMNAYEQNTTDLRTQSATVSSTGNGTTAREGFIEIESEFINGNQTCFDRVSTEKKTMMLQLKGVQFENTSVRGPWTDIVFGQGEADVVTILLPGNEFLDVLRQMGVSEGFIEFFEEEYDLASTGDAETTAGQTETDGPANESNDSTENVTESDEPTENATESDGESGNTTDDTGGGGEDSTGANETGTESVVDSIELAGEPSEAAIVQPR